MKCGRRISNIGWAQSAMRSKFHAIVFVIARRHPRIGAPNAVLYTTSKRSLIIALFGTAFFLPKNVSKLYIFSAKVKELVNRIQMFTNVSNEKVFLYEVIVAELVLHKGADINQMTQQSGNPDIQAQCNHHEMLKVVNFFLFSVIAQ